MMTILIFSRASSRILMRNHQPDRFEYAHEYQTFILNGMKMK